jgi:NAD(P)-dependent dehydrogenase (short-subunit alcohol dehydrogenase family)
MSKYQQLFRLDEKVAIVTGGAGILGAEFCRALCESGATVACVDVQEKPLTELVTTLKETYGDDKIVGYVCDVADPQSVNMTVQEITKRFSTIDILLNNAASRAKEINASSFLDYSLDVWRKAMSVNLDGMFLMAQAVGKQMIEQRKGTILQTASIYSLHGPDHRIYAGGEYEGKQMGTPAVYTASKAGVIGLTKHLATMWAEYGIRVNAICPGGVASGQNGEFHKKYSARIPMGRMAEIIEIVGPMLFLVSNAANYVTGQVFYADGGLSAW